MADPEVRDVWIATVELRWKNGRLEQAWRNCRSNQREWRVVPTDIGG